MAQIDNLTPENLDGLEKFIQNMQRSNPELTMKTYPMDEKPVDVHELAKKIDKLTEKIDFIFGDYFILDGKFISIKLSTK